MAFKTLCLSGKIKIFLSGNSLEKYSYSFKNLNYFIHTIIFCNVCLKIKSIPYFYLNRLILLISSIFLIPAPGPLVYCLYGELIDRQLAIKVIQYKETKHVRSIVVAGLSN